MAKKTSAFIPITIERFSRIPPKNAPNKLAPKANETLEILLKELENNKPEKKIGRAMKNPASKNFVRNGSPENELA